MKAKVGSKDRRCRAQGFWSRAEFSTAGMLSGYWPEAPAQAVDSQMNHEARALGRGLRALAYLDGRTDYE